MGRTKRSGPGRPTEFERDRAIEAAMHLLWKEGFPSVTARDLAEAMGIRRSSFYNSFGSREAVFREAVELYARQTPDAPLDGFEPGQPALPLLVGVFRRVCRVRAADEAGRGCLMCNSIAELVGVHETLGPMLESAWTSRIRTLERLLEAAVDRGELDGGSPIEEIRSAAGSIATFLLGLNIASKTLRSEDQLWALCRPFLRGLGVGKDLLDRARELDEQLESGGFEADGFETGQPGH